MHQQLAELHADTGDVAAAEACLRRVIELQPENGIAYRNLGTHLLIHGSPADAIEPLRKAIELQPDLAVALHHLAAALEATGGVDDAVKTYRQLLQTIPNYAPGYLPAASLLSARGDDAAAITVLRTGLEKFSRNVPLANALAWYLATSKDESLRSGDEAVKLAERAAELQGTADAMVLDTLAAAYAEAGRFQEAVDHAERAIQAAVEREDTELGDRIRNRKQLYEQGRAYHEDE